MTDRKSQKQEVDRDEKHADTDIQKHKAGGPGKSARHGHEEGGKSGNAPGQKQSGEGAPHRKHNP